MTQYRIHRMKEWRRSRFRWAPHTGGEAVVSPGHYEADASFEAATPYALWSELQATDQALVVGDLLESSDGELRIFKYVGFESARWAEPSEAEAEEPAVAETAG